MKKFKCFSTLLILAFAITFLDVSVLGQSTEDSNRIASAASNGDSVRFDLSVPYSAVTMTVSAPNGKVYRKEFKSGTAPIFKLLDKAGSRLPDGQYTYELRLTPVLSAELRKELAASREKGDDAAEDMEGRVRGALPTHPLVQSGGFSVQGGAVIVAGAVEGAAPRATPKLGKALRSAGDDAHVQSRASSLSDGAFFLDAVARRPSERTFVAGIPHPAFPDQVIPDDLIVQGSACVGLDCVNNENFGFDTIRLKENNTRLQFDDTSTSAGFPTNNWQIRANSSSSGGDSFLGFVDQGASGNSETGTVVLSVAAGAPANSIKVDSSGRLGIKTATPVLDVHANNSNTPAIRLEQNSSGGFTAQTWDIGGNEANFFVRDVTSGSRLPFRIRPGAPTSSIDITATGNVGIGTASPVFSANTAKFLGVDGGTGVFSEIGAGGNQSGVTAVLGTFSFFNSNRAGSDKRNAVIVGSNDGATDSGAISFYTTNAGTIGERMRILKNGQVGIGTATPDQVLSVNGDASKAGGGSWQTFSDERLKNIKGSFNSGLKALMQLQPLRYEYKQHNPLGLNASGEHVGFGAQALRKVIPEAVTQSSAGYLLVNNDPILWTMLNAIKEQQKEIDQLKTEVRRLRSRSARRR